MKKIIKYMRGLLFICFLLDLSFSMFTIDAKAQSTWTMPLPGGEIGCLINCGCSTHKGTHTGVDFKGMPEGSKVVSAEKGTIICAYDGDEWVCPTCNSSGAGKHVNIKHEGNYYAQYAHLSSVAVGVGQNVDKGQQIGGVGKTGVATGVHLHLLVSHGGSSVWNGTRIDPLTMFDQTLSSLIQSVTSSDITDTTAKITANLNRVYYDVTTCGFYYGKSPDDMQKVTEFPEDNEEVKNIWYELGTGKWTPALSPGTTYYYQVFVTIDGKEYKSAISSFTTTGQSINHNPQGWLDSATGGNSGFIISGWTFDPDVPTQSLQGDVYIGGPYGQGGTLIASLTADQLREDVGLDYPGVGNYHGFYGEIATDRVGEQPIYVYAINVGEGTENPLIGSSVVNITDGINPVVTNAYISQKDSDGYTVTATVYDNAGVAQIKFPTKRKDQEGDQYWKWLDGTQNADGSYSCRINISDFDNVSGTYLTEVRAWDAAENVSEPWRLPEQFMDKELPVVTSVEITQADATGYTVTATVTDNVGVTKVQFPTKRREQEGDQYWKWLDGTQNADGSYSCRINISDFDNATGHYITEVRAWDAAGNVSETGKLPERFYDVSAPSISSLSIPSVDKTGYTATAVISDDTGVSKVQFAAKLKEGDENQWKLFDGVKNADGTYTCRINADDFENTNGYYLTTVKAWDTSGNESEICQFAEQFIDTIAPEIHDIHESKWFEMSSVIEVEATDNVEITDLKLRVKPVNENTNVWQWLTGESDGSGKWTFAIDFQDLESGCGSYISEAVAYDAAGNERVSAIQGFTYDPYRWKLQVEMYAVNNNEGHIEQIYSVDKYGFQSKIDWRKFLDPIINDDVVTQSEYTDTLSKYNTEKTSIPTAFEEIDAVCTQLTGKENDVYLYWKKLAAEYLNLSGDEKESYLAGVQAKSEEFIKNPGDYFEQYWEIESHNWSEIYETLSTTKELDYNEIIAVSQILSEARIECYLANSAAEVQTIIDHVNNFRLAGFPENVKLVKTEIPESIYFGKVINNTDNSKNSFGGDLLEGRAELISNVLSSSDKEKLDEGKNVKIWMTLKDIQDNAPENDKILIADKLGDYTVGIYTDITLWKQFDNESEEKISETPGKITIQIDLPEELVNKNTLKERTYAIIYAHGDQAELIGCTVEGNKLSFEANKFSTYAIVYKDTIKILDSNDESKTENSSSGKTEDEKMVLKLPEVYEVTTGATNVVGANIAPTGDVNNVLLWMSALVLSSFILGASSLSRKNNKTNKH